MDIVKGNTYFISDSFFKLVNDPCLKINYPTTKRPHYYALRDPNESSLFWVVPLSSKVDKFENIIIQKKAQKKPHDAIQVIKLRDEKTVFLFQDMFPVCDKYFESQYIRKGKPVSVSDPKAVEALEKTALKIKTMLQNGVKFTPHSPDVRRIEKIMHSEIEKATALCQVARPRAKLTDVLELASKKADEYNKARDSETNIKAKKNGVTR